MPDSTIFPLLHLRDYLDSGLTKIPISLYLKGNSMKNFRIALLMLLSLCPATSIFSAEEAPNNIRDNLTAELHLALAEAKSPEEKSAILDLHNTTLRSIELGTTTADQGVNDVTYIPSVFNQTTNTLFCGAGGSNGAEAKQASILAEQITMATPQTISLVALAPVNVTVNGTAGTNNNLIYNKTIKNLALVGSTTRRQLATVTNETLTQISVITNLSNGTSVLQSSDIKDVNGDNINSIAGIAGSATANPFIFAAVSKNGATWRDATDNLSNGIACLVSTNNSLQQTNANDVTVFDTPQAMPINFEAGDNPMIAFSHGTFNAVFGTDNASDPNNVAMHWDSNLQRLFIGLNQVQPGSDTSGSGVVSLLIAGISTDKKTPFIKPIVNNPNEVILPAADQTKQIIGCGINSTTNAISTLLVKTMRTSTGKDYAIVNGGSIANIATINTVNSWVYALPIMPAGNDNAGQLAYINNANTFSLVTGAGQLTTVDQTHSSPAYDTGGTTFTDTEIRAVIGADPRFLSSLTTLPGDTTTVIKNMDVVGDSVYVTINGDNQTLGVDSNSGIFQSTALFDSNGLIRAWTPWQRTVGTSSFTGQITGFGLNTKNGSTQFLAGSGDAASATVWESLTPSASAESQIQDAFKNKGGIYKLINYDDRTSGFKPNAFSMVIAVGGDTVVIAQTGFSGTQPGTVSFTLNDPALTAIAPLTSAALVSNGTMGYLLISGLGGLVRVDQDEAGNGVTIPGNGISNLSVFSDTPTYRTVGSYKNITNLQTVSGHPERALVATLNQAFVIQAADQINPKVIVSIGDTPLTITKPFINDIQSGGNLIIAATTQGLFGMKISDGTPVSFPKIQGTPIKMQFLYDQRGSGNSGNLYVLSVSRDNNTGLMYRFDVNNEIITTIDVTSDNTPKPTNNLDQFASSFVTDGTSTFIVQPQENNLTNMLQVYVNTNNTTDALSVVDDQLNVSKTSSTNIFMGTPIRSTASGNWLVPGSFGLRAND